MYNLTAFTLKDMTTCGAANHHCIPRSRASSFKNWPDPPASRTQAALYALREGYASLDD